MVYVLRPARKGNLLCDFEIIELISQVETEKLKIQCAFKHFETLGFAPKTDRQYIAPIKDFPSLKQQALNANDQSIL